MMRENHTTIDLDSEETFKNPTDSDIVYPEKELCGNLHLEEFSPDENLLEEFSSEQMPNDERPDSIPYEPELPDDSPHRKKIPEEKPIKESPGEQVPLERANLESKWNYLKVCN